MTSLDRAKQFLASKARVLAVSAIPLAAVAVAPEANGAAIFTPGSCDILPNGATGSGTCSVTALGTAPNGVNGLHLVSESDWVTTSMSGGEFFIGLRWRASVNDQDPGTLPISWDFNLTAPADPNLFWELSIIYDNFFLYQSIAQGYGSSAQGTGWIAPGEPVTSLEIRLNISGFLTPGTSFHLSVPDQSIDINPSAVPEPSSALLLIPGLGYLAVRARRRKV